MANRKAKPKDAANEAGIAWARAVPKQVYESMSGRVTATLHDQADRYRLPLRGPTIDLFALVKRFHDFLAENKHRFIDDDPDVAGASSPALEELRRVKCEQERIKLAAMETRYVDRSLVKEFLGQLSTQIRQTGDRAESLFGPDGRELVNQMIDAVEVSLAKFETGEQDNGDGRD